MIRWWKITGAILVLYALVWGMLTPIPEKAILYESIRNVFYHVPMWFGMILLLLGSVIQAIRFLSKGDLKYDVHSSELVKASVLFGTLGIFTGMIWAKNTWGTYWTPDPKLNSVAIGMLIYFAYLVLRGSIEDEEKRARISAVYNVFSFPIFIVLIFILPRLNNVDSLHPGNGGNPAFSSYDLDSRMKMVFYPAVIGWTLIGYWIADLGIRKTLLENKE